MERDIGKRIWFLRKLNSFTRESFAEKIGVSPEYVGLLERGSRTPSLSLLIEICSLFNTSLDYIVKGLNCGFNPSGVAPPADGVGEVSSDIPKTDEAAARRLDFIINIQNIVKSCDLSDAGYLLLLKMIKWYVELLG